MNDKKAIDEMSRKYKEEMMRLYSKAAAKNIAAAPVSEPEKHEAVPVPDVPADDAAPVRETETVGSSKFPSPDEILRSEGINTEAAAASDDGIDGSSAEDDRMRGNYDFDPAEENIEENVLEPLYNGSADEKSEKLTGTGYLKTEVSTGGGASPVEGATVIISRKEGDKTLLIKMLVTGENGETAEAALPAPDLAYSETPDPEARPFAEYTLSIAADGYYMIPELTVPVFSTVKSIQPVSLIPLAEFDMQGSIAPSDENKKGR